jgi:hypothetical protein
MQSPTAPPAPAQHTAKSSYEGVVLRADSNEPMTGARVSIFPSIATFAVSPFPNAEGRPVTTFIGSLQATGRVLRGQPPAYPPQSGTAQFFVDLAPMPPSFDGDHLKYLCTAAKLIIVGTVQSTSVRVNGRHLETDAVLRIDTVVKGAETSHFVVIGQGGGSWGQYKEVTDQYSLMESNQRYVLFLEDDRRDELPPVPSGSHWYAVTRAWEGMFLIDDYQKLRLAHGAPTELRDKYDGMDVEEAMTHIRYWSNAH